MNKKGISPLIATVLIIGFVIVLAALVMQWGGALFKEVQEETGKTSDFKITCSSKLTGLEVSAKGNAVTVDNKNDMAIEGFMFRSYDAGGGLIGKPKMTSTVSLVGGTSIGANSKGVSAYQMFSYSNALQNNAKEVGVFPAVKVNGETMICENEWRVSVAEA